MKARIIVLLSTLVLSILTPSLTQADSTLRIFEPCSVSTVIPCIDGLSVIDESGKIHVGVLTGIEAPATMNFAQQIFSGTNFEWDVPGTNQPSGHSTLLLSGMYFPLNTPYCWLPNQDVKSCDYSIDEISLRVLTSPFEPSISQDLNKNYKYRISLKIPENFTPAMMAGEGSTGELSSTANSDGTRSVIFMGQPTEIVFSMNNDPNAPSAAGTELGFYLQSNLSAQVKWTNVCNEENLLSYWHNTGVGTTPIWSKSDGAIEMQTSGVHLKPDGTLNQGLIELQVPVKMAKCLWGVDLSHAVSATMSATYQDGSADQVITTMTSVKNNYFILSSYGFHYSSPLIKVKMVEDPIGVVAIPAPSEVVKVQQKTSTPKVIEITCLRGKLVKKISGSKPVCPAGYKKK